MMWVPPLCTLYYVGPLYVLCTMWDPCLYYVLCGTPVCTMYYVGPLYVLCGTPVCTMDYVGPLYVLCGTPVCTMLVPEVPLLSNHSPLYSRN